PVAARADRQITRHMLRSRRQIPAPLDGAAPDAHTQERGDGRVRGDETAHLRYAGRRRPHDAAARVDADAHDCANVLLVPGQHVAYLAIPGVVEEHTLSVTGAMQLLDARLVCGMS